MFPVIQDFQVFLLHPRYLIYPHYHYYHPNFPWLQLLVFVFLVVPVLVVSTSFVDDDVMVAYHFQPEQRHLNLNILSVHRVVACLLYYFSSLSLLFSYHPFLRPHLHVNLLNNFVHHLPLSRYQMVDHVEFDTYHDILSVVSLDQNFASSCSFSVAVVVLLATDSHSYYYYYY